MAWHGKRSLCVQGDVELMEAWLRDLMEIGYEFPRPHALGGEKASAPPLLHGKEAGAEQLGAAGRTRRVAEQDGPTIVTRTPLQWHRYDKCASSCHMHACHV
jgi:hypothetical protein